MRLVMISDIHEQWGNLEIPHADLLIIAGDISYRDYKEPVENELPYLHKLNDWCRMVKRKRVKEVIVIAGNHDRSFEKFPETARECLSDVIYLQGESTIFQGYKFYGTPWTKRFGDWAFMIDSEEQEDALFRQIPDDTDILITHEPPYGILDECTDGRRIGSRPLRDRVKEICPIIHAYGHVHHSYGMAVDADTGTLFVNASTCTEKYLPKNRPIVVEIH